MAELTGKERSPLEALSKIRFQGRTFAVETVTAVGTTRVSVLKNNPNRVFAILINESANDVRVSIDGSLTSTSGFLLMSNGGLIEISWENDGEATGYELFAISSVAGCNVRAHEVIRI